MLTGLGQSPGRPDSDHQFKPLHDSRRTQASRQPSDTRGAAAGGNVGCPTHLSPPGNRALKLTAARVIKSTSISEERARVPGGARTRSGGGDRLPRYHWQRPDSSVVTNSHHREIIRLRGACDELPCFLGHTRHNNSGGAAPHSSRGSPLASPLSARFLGFHH